MTSQLKAFRDAVLLSQVAATALVVLRMPVLWAGIAIALVEAALMLLTWYWLSD